MKGIGLFQIHLLLRAAPSLSYICGDASELVMGATRASGPFVQNCRDGSDTWERLNIGSKILAKVVSWVMRADPNKLAP